MNAFSADWLAMREPYDAQARNPAVLAQVADAFGGRPALAVVDLGCGTGATRRAIAPYLPRPQYWRLVDNDLWLLAHAVTAPELNDCMAIPTPLDLVRDLETALGPPVDLVTATALFDLVSAQWLERLLVETAARHLPLYAALIYDGRVRLAPANALDASVIAAANRHQGIDKGFGPALGALAAPAMIARCRAMGHVVLADTADWVIGPDDRDIQLRVLATWALAARTSGGLAESELFDWLHERSALVAAGCSSMRIGHIDVFARPTRTRRDERSTSNNTSSSSRYA